MCLSFAHWLLRKLWLPRRGELALLTGENLTEKPQTQERGLRDLSQRKRCLTPISITIIGAPRSPRGGLILR